MIFICLDHIFIYKNKLSMILKSIKYFNECDLIMKLQIILSQTYSKSYRVYPTRSRTLRCRVRVYSGPHRSYLYNLWHVQNKKSFSPCLRIKIRPEEKSPPSFSLSLNLPISLCKRYFGYFD